MAEINYNPTAEKEIFNVLDNHENLFNQLPGKNKTTLYFHKRGGMVQVFPEKSKIELNLNIQDNELFSSLDKISRGKKN